MPSARLGNALLLAGLVALAVLLALCQQDFWWQGSPSSVRIALAASSMAGLFVVAFVCLRPKQAMAVAKGDVLLLWASQSGHAEALAGQAQAMLQEAGRSARALPLTAASPALLQQCRQALVIASTTGEGDAPDHAAGFLPALQSRQLAGLEYAVLALGDRRYTRFCAYGRAIDAALAEVGGKALFARIEVDAADAAALRTWQQQLTATFGIDTALASAAPVAVDWQRWRLTSREHLNPGSPSAPVHALCLVHADADAADWQAGDIAIIAPRHPSERVQEWLRASGHLATERVEDAAGTCELGKMLARSCLPDPRQVHGMSTTEIASLLSPLPEREYSIASIPAEGHLQLLVREMRDASGQLGLGSGWLGHHADIGTEIALRIRKNPSFHDADPQTPLILIATGTGIAGVRAHLAARARVGGGRCWLLFGERSPAHDFHLASDIRRWQAEGLIEKLDLAFSRDLENPRYIQQALSENAACLRDWLGRRGAAIHICGSLQRMAPAVEAVLRQTLGDAAFASLQAEGRYRREVY